MRIIDIKNIAMNKMFIRGSGGEWTSYPMRLPVKYLPPRWDISRLSRRPERLSGFDVHLFTNPRGARYYYAEALNFFAVLKEMPDGLREEYLDIRVGAQPDHLFAPPRMPR